MGSDESAGASSGILRSLLVALTNRRYDRPMGRTVINLAPADLPKAAGAFDLPIALGMLVGTRQLLAESLRDSASVGELALDGSVRPVRGGLSMAMAARDRGLKKLIVPAANAREAAVVVEIEVFGVNGLAEAVGSRFVNTPAGSVTDTERMKELTSAVGW